MDLRKRLAQLDRLAKRPEAVAPAETIVPERLAAALRTLGLQETAGAHGTVWTREVRDRVRRPGRLPSFDGFLTHADEVVPRAGDLLFIDAETTGLAGGTGTLAFLVGASWYGRGGLTTRQYFLSSPAQEAAMVASLAELAADFRVVVSFNGASFDLPLLRTRALMNRARDPLGGLVSWDLLVPARRLWRRRLENCRQQTLETEVCDLPEREGDIDGAQIPAVWFEFLRTGDTGKLERVLHHNRLDMVGMAFLLACIADRARSVPRPDAGVDGGDWRDAWSIGLIAEKRRDRKAAAAWCVRAWDLALGHGVVVPERFLADAVRILKRVADWARVQEMLAVGLARGGTPWLHREAAILYEHRLPDLEKALAHARSCGENPRTERLERRITAQKEKEPR